MSRKNQPTRRDLLKAAAVSAPAVNLGAIQKLAQGGQSGRRERQKNVVIFMTDQERAIQHFPVNWERDNLHGLTRLKAHGLTFERAFTNACMCSPARSTWMSGYFPAQHGVKYTLEEDMPVEQYPDQVELPVKLANIASVMSSVGYNVVYKGKWHCSKPAGAEWVPSDVADYGFSRWNPQDAGANQDVDQGGGSPDQSWRVSNNDGRFMNADGDWQTGNEGVLAYLNKEAVAEQPFCLIISLVNPHDVLFYPNPNSYEMAGYDEFWFKGDIRIPATVDEDLSTKPRVQRQFLDLSQLLGPLPTREMKRKYLNFYGNLMKSSDKYLCQVLDALDHLQLTDDTLIIRTADHGEMGLTHGGQRQKNFNFYEEAIRVPLVFSNPRLYPRVRQSRALVSHVDFLPTLAGLFEVPASARVNWQGIDYSSIVLNPDAPPVQDYIVFTYDDYQSGQKQGPYPTPPNHIVSIREKRYKLAEYYDVAQRGPTEWEMYDLDQDPLERTNLANGRRTREQQLQYERLRAKLAAVKERRLQPLT